MSDFRDMKKVILERLVTIEKNFNNFLKILSAKKPEPYMELGCVVLCEDMMVATHTFNKMKYEIHKIEYKITQLSKNEESKEDPEDCSIKFANMKINAAKKKSDETYDSKEGATGDNSRKSSVEKNKLILELYELNEERKNLVGKWKVQLHKMLEIGEKKKWDILQLVYWKKFEGFVEISTIRIIN